MSKIVSDPRLPTVNDEKIRPLTQRLYELFRQYAIAHNKSYMWDTEGTAAPTTGTWAISQMCKNTSPTGTGTVIIGWVCIASGTPGTWIEISGGGWRETLAGNRTYYVRTDGSNSNDGLTNTSGGAFLTIQNAIDVICSTIDTAVYTITIQVADGTYTTPIIAKEFVGAGNIVITGNASTPTNVVVSTTSANCLTNTCGSVGYSINNMKLTTTTSGNCIYCSSNSRVYFSGIDFGSCATHHIFSEQRGIIQALGAYTISGSATYHYSSGSQSEVRATGSSWTITISNSPTFSIFAFCGALGFIHTQSITFSGTVTGKRYEVIENGVIKTYGSGANLFPGTVAGTTATGGQYT